MDPEKSLEFISERGGDKLRPFTEIYDTALCWLDYGVLFRKQELPKIVFKMWHALYNVTIIK